VRSTQDFPNSIAKGVSIFDTLRESAAREDIDLLAKEILDINPEITLANELRETTRQQREASL
jgi:chromosome partitioning protein